ncbi:MAG: class I SAM-dependent methyltransferase [Candidatus Thorarchaeota archaeon]|jgi:SAM-dependent methyltransferase
MPERPSEKYYRDTARFYDAFSERPDETFYLELAKRFGSPILELACGTGRVTLMLAQAGYDITGIELSPEMLEIAQEKLRELPEDVQSRVSLNHGDITSFQLDKEFAMVIIPWAFKFLLTTDDQLACLRQVRKHLADDGSFILDLYHREATDMPETEKKTVEIDGAAITRTYTYSNDLITQLGHTNTVVDVVYSDGKTESFESDSIVSIIMPREADLLVRTAGFEIAEEYGGDDFSEYKPEDWKRVLVLKKERL